MIYMVDEEGNCSPFNVAIKKTMSSSQVPWQLKH